MERKMRPPRVRRATGAAGLGALLAACGGSSDSGGRRRRPRPSRPRAPPAEPAATAEAATPPAATGADVRPGLRAGRDDRALRVGRLRRHAPWMWETTSSGEYGKASPLKFTFLENDQPGAREGRLGLQPGHHPPLHRLLAGLGAAGLIQPFDTSLLPDYEGIPEAIRSGRRRRSTARSTTCRSTSASPRSSTAPTRSRSTETESWNILLDDAYKGKLSIYSDDVTIIKIGALINEGAIDPNMLTTEQIQAAKETMKKAKPNIRNFWSSNTDTIRTTSSTATSGPTYMWPDGYWKIKNHPKMKDVDDPLHVAEGGPARPGSAASS